VLLINQYNLFAGRIWIFLLLWITLAPWHFFRLQNAG